MTDLPDYASHFVNMICRILQEYLESCQQAYHGLFVLISACVLAFITSAEIRSYAVGHIPVLSVCLCVNRNTQKYPFQFYETL